MAHQNIARPQRGADLCRIVPGMPGKDKIRMAWQNFEIQLFQLSGERVSRLDHGLAGLLQIVGIQAAYYASFFALTAFTTVVAGLHFTLDYIFDWKTIRADNTLGWTWGFIWVLNALVMYVPCPLQSLYQEFDGG